MIDEAATFEKFGYYSTDWTTKSHKKIIVVCDGCGKVRELEKKQYHALCKSCTMKGCVKKGKSHPNWKGGPVEIVCSECGKKYTVFPSRIRYGGINYCSRKCMGIGLSKRIECFCLECGKDFDATPSQIKKGRGKYCSRKCQGIAQSKNRNGKKSPVWKGGVSFEPYCYKFNEEFRQYIRAKFGNVCFLCDKTEEENGKRLSVHHVNYNKECGCADTEEKRKADDNVCQFVPLCISCNSRVNFNRDFWERKIKNEMRNKLNGWYI